MRFMVMVKASPESERGVMPTEQQLAEMGNYNEELVKAGVMVSGEGLHPTSKGARVRFEGDDTSVINGPFSGNDLVAGFWILQCKSLDEAVSWIRRAPNPQPGHVSEVEIRQIFEAEDFGAEFTPELRAQEERMRAKLNE